MMKLRHTVHRLRDLTSDHLEIPDTGYSYGAREVRRIYRELRHAGLATYRARDIVAALIYTGTRSRNVRPPREETT